MRIDANSIEEYISKIPEARQDAFCRLRQVIRSNIPQGFEERMSYGMVGFVVPHSLYPDGYHCEPELPLPFVSLGNQKNFLAMYHSGIYADTHIHDWFVSEYPKYVKTKLDMGKSCVRFKNMNHIPYDLIAELMTKMTVDQWIELYETRNKRGAC